MGNPYTMSLFEDEGFDSWGSMRDFFADLYGLPFNGFLHRWKPITRYCDGVRLGWELLDPKNKGVYFFPGLFGALVYSEHKNRPIAMNGSPL